MKQTLKKFFSHPRLQEILRFGLVGVAATLLQFILYYLLTSFLGHNLSLLISYAASLCMNFLLTVYFTFRVKPTAHRGAGFLASHALNFGMQFVLLNLFIWLGVDKQLALIPVLAVCIPVNFLLVRLSMRH